MTERFENFTRNVSVAGKCIAKIKAHEMHRFGIRGGDVMCLFFIGKNPDGLTPTEISELCGEDKAGISRSLAALREKGYVEADGDGRKYRMKYTMTAAGKAVFDALGEAINRAVESAGGTLPDKDRDTFYRIFDTITERLVTICDMLDEK